MRESQTTIGKADEKQYDDRISTKTQNEIYCLDVLLQLLDKNS